MGYRQRSLSDPLHWGTSEKGDDSKLGRVIADRGKRRAMGRTGPSCRPSASLPPL